LSLFAELRRRNVFRVAIAYVVLAWLMAQVAELLLDAFGAPEWALKSILGLFIVGFPFAVFFAWAFELTPEGIKREDEVDRGASITPRTGRKLDRAIIALLSLALAWFAWERYQPRDTTQHSVSSSADVGSAPPPATEGSDFPPVIAVLPFLATGTDDGGFLAVGLYDDLLTRLAKLGAFRVISRTSMMEYAEGTHNMRQIGAELGAGYILEGGVQARGNRVRINAQLIDAATDRHLWAEIYDRELTALDLFDIQSELAIAIAQALKTTLSPEDQAVLDDLPTHNMEAYSAYLRGLEHREAAGFIGGARGLKTLEAFEEAVRLDPEFALAWASLSTVRSELAGVTNDPELSEAALSALAKARSLKPGLLEAELARVDYLYRVEREYGQAVKALEALGERAAGNVRAQKLKVWLYRRLGRFEDSYQTSEAALRLDPRDAGIHINLAAIAILIDDCPAAGRHANDALMLAPEASHVRIYAAEYELECTGNARRASELLRGVDLANEGGSFAAYKAAMGERDFSRALILADIVEKPVQPQDLLYRQLRRATGLQFLNPDGEAYREAMYQAESELALLARDPQLLESAAYAEGRIRYHAINGDADDVLFWINEHKRRFHSEFKGDALQEGHYHLYYAMNLADAGLLDDSVAELRTMLEQPGGHRFPYIHVWPVFDDLASHPGFEELRQQYGNPQMKGH